MSAYKRIKCKIVNKECLLEALKDLGLVSNVYENPVALHGYTGALRNNKAEIVVLKAQLNKNFTGASNDLGFTWNENENAYDMICSEYDVNARIPQRIMQAYAVSVIKKAASVNNFTVKENIDASSLKSKTMKKVKLVFGKVI